MQNSHKRGRGYRQCAWKTEMFIAFSVLYWRQRIDRQFRREFLESAPKQEIIDERVGCQRQMGAVLFDGGGRQKEERGFPGQCVGLLPIQIGKVPRVGYPRLH